MLLDSSDPLSDIVGTVHIDIDTTKTAMLLGFNRNTINRWYNIFRQEIYEYQTNQKNILFGSVEVDESYAKRQRDYHGKLKRGRGTLKQPVFGIFERQGRVYTEIVPDCKKKTLQDIIFSKVEPDSVIYSDGWRGYNGLVDAGYAKHFRVNHGDNEFAHDNCHINGIESFGVLLSVETR